MKELQIIQSVADVSGIAMEPQPRYLFLSRNEPAMKHHPVGSGEIDIFERQSPAGRVADEVAIREKDKVLLHQPNSTQHCHVAVQRYPYGIGYWLALSHETIEDPSIAGEFR